MDASRLLRELYRHEGVEQRLRLQAQPAEGETVSEAWQRRITTEYRLGRLRASRNRRR